jgi:hypothetical protein
MLVDAAGVSPLDFLDAQEKVIYSLPRNAEISEAKSNN